MSKYILKCEMLEDCYETVTHIDEKGFIYCEDCGLNRKTTHKCRKLTPKELDTLKSGKPIKGY